MEIQTESKESKNGTFARIIIWRVIALALSIIVVYIFTGNVLSSIHIAITSNVVKIIFHYLYERLWMYCCIKN